MTSTSSPVIVAAAILAASAGCALASNHGTPLKQQWPWYRSGDEIHAQFQELSTSCNGAQAELSTMSRVNSGSAAGTEVDLDVLHVSRQGKGSQPKVRAMLVFGEHARELITGEAALGLAKALCGGNDPTANKALDAADFILVPNANPVSRKMVEKGYYCKRTNEDGVDLNRNWSDEHRDTSLPQGDEMYPGPSGFSEPETQLLQGLVDQERPDVYLSVHSGAYLLGTPYGFEDRPPSDEAAMEEVLKPISQKYCPDGCPYGNLAKLIHYENPGCDIDYVYDKLHTPYVFTWEIFVGEDFRGGYNMEAKMVNGGSKSFLQKRQHRWRKGNSANRGRLGVRGPEAQQEVTSCMDQFNPQSQEETEAVVQNWVGAFLDLASEVAAKKGGQAGAGAPAAEGVTEADAALANAVLPTVSGVAAGNATSNTAPSAPAAASGETYPKDIVSQMHAMIADWKDDK